MDSLVKYQEEINRIFTDAFHLDPPEAEADLIDKGVLDSMMFVELLLQLEERFHFTISRDELDLNSFRSIGRIASYVMSNGENGVQRALKD